YASNLEAASKDYSQEELRILRKSEPVTEELFDKITKNILKMAAFLFAAHPGVKELPPAIELPYTFIFRYAMCGYLLALRWISLGGFKDARPERVRNDIVDVTFSAYGTYF